MILRLIGAVLALATIATYCFLPKKRVSSEVPTRESSRISALFLASALTLFVELALIRWVATEIRIFAYAKNLALLLCFLGFGLGCALARETPRWRATAGTLLALILVVRFPWFSEQLMENLSRYLGAGRHLDVWATGPERHWELFLLGSAVSLVLFFLLTYIFIPLGQKVSREIEVSERPLLGYSWNLAGSLVGILAFFGVSWMALPPAVWFAIVLAGIAVLQPPGKERILIGFAIIPAIFLLLSPATAHHFNLWTPYQQIEVQDLFFPNGELKSSEIRVNHTGYQAIVNLSDDFIARHPGLLQQTPEYIPYNLPFRFVGAKPRVLIVGSGTGNDVAAALRNGSSSIDAVEIDPAILKLGERHPEHPYSDPRVHAHLTDARAFMKRAHGPYDLILFGLLDSHTQMSDYSNMRIDNFVYTVESFREARKLLTPDGVVFVKFQVNHIWLGKRLALMLANTFGTAPTARPAHDRQLAVFVSGPAYNSSCLFCTQFTCHHRSYRFLSSDSERAQSHALTIFLQHGSWISPARNTSGQPTRLVFRNDVAGERHRDRRGFGGVAHRELRYRATAKTSATLVGTCFASVRDSFRLFVSVPASTGASRLSRRGRRARFQRPCVLCRAAVFRRIPADRFSCHRSGREHAWGGARRPA